MGSNAIFFAWNRPITGRERISGEHFQDFVAYLKGLQEKGTIESFEPVFLDPHGGDMNGFFLIRGQGAKLDTLIADEGWETHMIRAGMHLEGNGFVRACTGNLVFQRMGVWKSLIP